MAARPIAGIDEPIVWLLLREGVAANCYTGDTARALRVNSSLFRGTARAWAGYGRVHHDR